MANNSSQEYTALGISSKVLCAIIVATGLWFFMFSPWTSGMVDFWYMMTASALVLIALALLGGKSLKLLKPFKPFKPITLLLIGAAIAATLWVAFWVGDKLSQLMFDFARPQVDGIYGMKGATNTTFIALALLFIIGPAEEIFWHGYVQEHLQSKFGKNTGFIVATLIYTLIHIWSLNFMLIMAAMVCGICWGGLYRLDKRLLPALVISHALWDCAAFVVFPF